MTCFKAADSEDENNSWIRYSVTLAGLKTTFSDDLMGLMVSGHTD